MFLTSLLEHFSENDPVLNHPDPSSEVTGIIILPEGPMLIASRPIVTSNGEGPIRGTLFMGRFLVSQEIDLLAEKTSLSIKVSPINNPQMSPDMSTAMDILSGEKTEYIKPLDEGTIAGYTKINDIYGNPALLLRIDTPRDFYLQGERSLEYFIFSLFLVGIISLAVILMLLKKWYFPGW